MRHAGRGRRLIAWRRGAQKGVWNAYPLIINEIFATLADLNAHGLSLLIVEQHVSAALGLADYVYVLREGGIVTQGTPAFLQQDDRLHAAYLGRSDSSIASSG